MRARVDAGSDVAKLGAWDESFSVDSLPSPYEAWEAALNADAIAGHVFIVNLGGDGGGAVDIYVDEQMPVSRRRKLVGLGDAFLLRVPTGRLVVGGVEDYRSKIRRSTSDRSVVSVAPGSYELRCFAARDEESDSVALPVAEIRSAVGVEDYRYYKREERRTLYGYLILVAIPFFAEFVGWWLAGVGTILLLAAFVRYREWSQSRDERFQRVRATETELMLQAEAKASPFLALELRRLEGQEPSAGGIVDLEKAMVSGDKGENGRPLPILERIVR